MNEETIAKVVELANKLKDLEVAKKLIQAPTVRLGYMSYFQGSEYAITNGILKEITDAHDACIRSEIDELITKCKNEQREL